MLHYVASCFISNDFQVSTRVQFSCEKFNCFLAENYILDNVDKFQHLPAIIIHGRYDMVCQAIVAQELSKKWLNAQLQILPQAGHSGFEKQTIDAFCKATDVMANFLEERTL